MTLEITNVGKKIKVSYNGGVSESTYLDYDDITLSYLADVSMIRVSTKESNLNSLNNTLNVPIANVTIGGIVITSQAVFDTQLEEVFINAGGAAITTQREVIIDWQISGSEVYVSGIPTSQFQTGLYVPNPLNHGNTYAEVGHGIRQNCNITSIKLHVFDFSVGAVWAFKLFRWNAATSLYDCIASRDFTPTTNAAVNTITLSTPVEAMEGDIPGLFIPATNYNRLYVGPDTSKATPLPVFATDTNVAEGASNAMANSVPDYFLNIACYSNRPYAVFIGDSIFGGGNGYIYPPDGREWRTDQENSAEPTPGAFDGDKNLSVPYRLSNHLSSSFQYQNFAKGGSTFATVVTVDQQLTRAVLADPKFVFIHCGVNDVATGRLWVAIEANLDTIRTAFPVGTKFVLNEINPFQGSDAQAATVRTFNVNYALYCTTHGWILAKCHDEMAIVRPSTGLLDDLNPIYSNGDSVHLNSLGAGVLAKIIKRYL